jgi:polysaccharide chain length determinant protein (PEP-CTERM system associated)
MPKEKLPYTISDWFAILRRRRVYVATIFPAAIFISVYLAFVLPPMYRSSGVLLLEQASVPQDLVRSTVATLSDQQIELVRRRVMTLDALAELVEEQDPYPKNTSLSNRAKARLIRENTSIEKVDPITMKPMADSLAFSISYLNPDAVLAADMAKRIVFLFLDYNRATRTERASETYAFLQAQSLDAEMRVAEAEQRLADFKNKYGDAIPEAQTRNLTALDRAQRDLENYQSDLRAAEERRALYELQLSSVNPYLFSEAGDWRTELASLKAQLAEAQQRYTEDHPDVRRLKRSIAALSERAAADPNSVQKRPDNPEYLRIQGQVRSAEKEVEFLRMNVGRERQQIAKYERRLNMAPDVEREYRQLVRDQDIAQNQYREIETKLGEAKIAQMLESQNQGARLTLIVEPYVPSAPYSPNRVAMILLGVVLGLALSAVSIAIRDSADPSIRSVRDLGEITDIKPIGAIPFVFSRGDKRKRAMLWGAYALTVGIVLIIVSTAVVNSPA